MFKVFGFTLILSIMLAGCASLPDDQSVQNRAKQSSQSNHDSNTLLQRAKLKMAKANSENLALYGPSYLIKAKESYRKAQALYKEKQNESDIKFEAELAIEYVNAGLRNKRVVKDALKASLDHYQILMELEADKVNSDLFQATKQSLIELVKQIEQRQLDSAIASEAQTIELMRNLEINVIKKKYLQQCSKLISQSEQKQASLLLPKTYKQIINQLSDTQQFIRQNPRQTLKIQELADDCSFQAQRLLNLANEASKIKSIQNEDIEKHILKTETQLARIAKQLTSQDFRNLSFDDQSFRLSEHAETSSDLLAAAEDTSAQLSPAQFEKWKRKTVLLQSEVRRLQKIIKQMEASNN